MNTVMMAGLVFVVSMIATVIVVSIMNVLDPSPVFDDNCRGGHDF